MDTQDSMTALSTAYRVVAADGDNYPQVFSLTLNSYYNKNYSHNQKIIAKYRNIPTCKQINISEVQEATLQRIRQVLRDRTSSGFWQCCSK